MIKTKKQSDDEDGYDDDADEGVRFKPGGASPNVAVLRVGSVAGGGSNVTMTRYPLGAAAMNGHAEVVKLLLSHPDVDPNAGTARGPRGVLDATSPLLLAAKHGGGRVTSSQLSPHPHRIWVIPIPLHPTGLTRLHSTLFQKPTRLIILTTINICRLYTPHLTSVYTFCKAAPLLSLSRAIETKRTSGNRTLDAP